MTANLLKSADYFSNLQNSTATLKLFSPPMRFSQINDYWRFDTQSDRHFRT